MGKIRARTVKVCDFCRKRKVKCDLGNPCSTCVKYKKSPCIYSDFPTSSITTNSNTEKQDNEFVFENNGTQRSRIPSNSTISTLNSNGSRVGSIFSNSLSRTTTLSNENEIGNNEEVNNDNDYDIPEEYEPSHPTTSSTIPQPVSDELSFLKQKLQDLEEKFQIQTQSQQNSSNTSPFNNSNTNQISPNSNNYSNKDILINKLDPQDLLGHNPYESENDWFNFFEGYNPTNSKEQFRKKNYGPLNWVTLLKIDSAINSVWSEMANLKKQMKERGFVHGFQITDQSAQVDKDFSEKAYDDEGNNDVKPFTEFDNINKPIKSKLIMSQSKLNEKAMCLGLSFYKGGLDTEVELVEKIRLVLPKQKVIWILFKRFFSHLYVAMPVIDQMILKSELEKLIGKENYQNNEVNVKITKKLDFANLGILLIILRFSYISLFSQDSSINEINFQTNDPSKQQIKFLLNNPINLDVINVAKLCLDQFNIMRGSNLTLLQLALLFRLYNYYAPEAGDGIDGGDAQIFNATLIQMAMSIGLHREPDKFKNNDTSGNDDRLDNLGRKIWYYLLIQDMNNSMANGSPCTINFNSFDTKPPFYRPGNENVLDIEIEKVACGCFPNFDNTYEPMSETFNTIFSIKNSINMIELTKRLNHMELHFKEKHNNLTLKYGNSLNDENSNSTNILMPSTIKLKIYFTGNFFLVSIYLYLFNFYEKRKNLKLSFYYLKKMISIIIYDVMPFFVECINHKKNMFKSSIDLIATPSFLTAAHKSVIVLTSFYLRIKFWICNLEKKYNHNTKLRSNDEQDNSYKLHFQKLINLENLILKSIDIFRNGIAKLSYRYYYAWRITKAQNFLRTSFNDEFFKNYQPTNASFKDQILNNEMLEQLEYIFEKSILQVNKIKKQYKLDKLNFEPENKNNNLNNLNYNNNQNLNHRNSTSSGNSSDNEYHRPNDQIDSIWLQMMNLKNDNNFNFNLNSNFNNTNLSSNLKYNDQVNNTMNSIINPITPSNFINNLSYSPPSYNYQTQQQQSPLNQNQNQQQQTQQDPNQSQSQAGPNGLIPQQFQVDFNNYFNDKDMFENFPLDELLKDFS
ncbi:uncharacterized protein KGF55_005166 [Candida pseudojiufengensis]|uniref:uncharacterized protein n=1 Tax=Candida pseudojiufengensis TaxID=497109 RepID=UPI0022249865|nr:uncharacterized protein KGF55_005166 [Candida pseudojiufengensis]KAI5959934.1 hypothetical protein KGF55_005166 [Candida pseudojiufengensis]